MKSLKKQMALFMALVMIIGLFSGLGITATAAGGTWSGSGTSADPYLIEDADDLWALANGVDAFSGSSLYTGVHFKLVADITVSDWLPIGQSSSKRFRGVFDGNCHTITITNMSSANTSLYAGLFGYLEGSVYNTIVDGDISKVISTSSTVYAGGIAAYSNGAIIVNCVNKANVTASSTSISSAAGGIVGHTTNIATRVLNCYNEGTISANGSRFGGIAGFVNSGTVKNCITTTDKIEGGNWGTMSNCHKLSDLTANQFDQAALDEWNAETASYTPVSFWKLDDDGYPESAILCAHDFAFDSTVAPTCEEDGYDLHLCNLCGAPKKVIDAGTALGHDLVETTVPATCTVPGSYSAVCDRAGCDHTETSVLPATGHTPDSDLTEEFFTHYDYTCADCGEEYTVYKDERLRVVQADGVTVSFSTGGAREWEYDAVGDRLRSTNFNVGGTSSITTITFSSAEDFKLSFDYAVSSEGGIYDYLLIVLKDGLNAEKFKHQIAETYSGGTGAMQSASYPSTELAAGTYTLELTYKKDVSGNRGDDRGYISNIVAETLCTHDDATQVGSFVAATCTEDGHWNYHCPDCDRTFKVYNPGAPAHGHSFGADNICTSCGEQKAWDGTTKTEPALASGVYQISSGEELAWFAERVNGSSTYAPIRAVLTSNINLGDHEWTPIGRSSTYFYSGTFDGAGHSITGLNVNITTSSTPAGLFGHVKGATIKNLAVYGDIAGYLTPNGMSGYYAGGFIGEATSVTIDQCANYASVSGYYSGGFVGNVQSSGRGALKITNSYNAGEITGLTAQGQAGGFFGQIAGANGADQYENLFNYGVISGISSSGTLWGWAASENSDKAVNVYYLNTQTYSSERTIGTGVDADEIKGITAALNGSQDPAPFVDGDDHPILAWMTTSSNTEPPEPVITWIEITSEAELSALAAKVNSGENTAGEYYKLMNDLTLSGAFEPIGKYMVGGDYSFAGYFDGQGHTITLNITDTTGSNARAALFGSVVGLNDGDRAVIENLTVNGSVTATNGGNRVAGLVAYAKNADIINCGNGAAVTNNSAANANFAAGVVGRADENVTISGCFNSGVITVGGHAAGIVSDVGGSNVVIENCYNIGALSAAGAAGRIGGIVAAPGNFAVTIENSYATNVENYTASAVGAIVGNISQSLVITDVWYENFGTVSWIGGETYGWSGTAPAKFTDYAALLESLGAEFKANGTEYPILTWQTGSIPVIPPHTHSYTSVVTAPTCTDAGYTTHTCACGHSYADSATPATGHSYGSHTSNGDGTHSHTCADCGDTENEACIFDSGVVTTEPTYSTPGVMTYTCTICGYVKTEAIDTLDFEFGSGSSTDPFVISNEADLRTLATNVNAGESYTGVYFEVSDDIALTSAWTPIGGKDNAFSGSFNGGGFTISGIEINDGTKDFNGLFGWIEDATVSYVIVDGDINGGAFSAGIAGYARNSTISYCGNLADVTARNNNTYTQYTGPYESYVGGIVAYSTAGTQIIGSFNRGNILSSPTQASGNSRFAGGIVGYLYNNGTTPCSVSYSYNTGTVKAPAYNAYTYIGGIAGMSNSNTVVYCYSAGDVSRTSGTAGYAGGVIGSGNAFYVANAMNYYLESSADRGHGTTSDSTAYVQSATWEELTAAGGVFTALSTNFQLSGGAFNNGFFILNWETDLSATIGYITEIYTRADMYEFMNNVRLGHTYSGETVKLMNDVDLGGWYNSATDFGSTWSAIGDINGYMFEGTFDGQGKTIENMVIVNSSSGYLGLFSVNAGTIKNLTVEGNVAGSLNTGMGGIVGKNLGTIENCTADVYIRAVSCSYVGGIAADSSGIIKDCVNLGKIEGKVSGYAASGYVGGIVGHLENIGAPASAILNTRPEIDGCVNVGDVSGGSYVGGIVGGSFLSDGVGITITASADITNCANHGNVTSESYAGGIAGYMSALSDNFDAMYITNCYNTGDIKGVGDVGGIVGSANLSELTIENCYNAGKITAGAGANGAFAGEIAGFTKASIINSFYLLRDISEDKTAIGGGSSENYARPASEDYMKSAAFAAVLGSAYSASASAYPTLVIE